MFGIGIVGRMALIAPIGLSLPDASAAPNLVGGLSDISAYCGRRFAHE
jgi:hypothetical protein